MSGFVANPGTDFSHGQLPDLAARLDRLAKQLGITIHGISGYRTPAHSVAVGGFANDPHTKGLAADIGVNSSLRSTASQLTDAQLASVGLYRPFPGSQEINHIQIGKRGDQLQAVGSAKPSYPSIVPGLDAGGGDGGGVLGDVNRAAGGAAGELVGALAGALGEDGARIVMWVVLVVGGTVLGVLGISRLTGLKPTPIPNLAKAAV